MFPYKKPLFLFQHYQYFKSKSGLSIGLLQSLILIFKLMFKKHEGKEFIEVKNAAGSFKKFIKSKLLGTGGFARCYQVILQQTNQKYAVKIVKKSQLTEPKLKQTLKSQIAIHRQMHHDNIVKYIDSFQNKDYVYILLQVCNNQTLNQLLRRRKYLSQLQVRYYIRQLILAIQYLQANKIIHRDIKLCNLFIADDLQLKLGDFGLATKIKTLNQRKFTHCGTINYIAPQILTGQQQGHSYEVDIWSLGVVTFTLLYGKYPFENYDQKIIENSIVKCCYQFPTNPQVSVQAKKFISKIFQLDPCKRPTPKELLIDEFITKSQIPKIIPNRALNSPLQKTFIKRYQQNVAKPTRFQALKDITILTAQNNFRPQENIKARQQSLKYKMNYSQISPTENKEEVDWVLSLRQFKNIGIAYMTEQNFLVVRFNDQIIVVAHPQLQKLQLFKGIKQKKQSYFQFLSVFQFQDMFPTHFKQFYSIATQMIENFYTTFQQDYTKELYLHKKFKIPMNIYSLDNGYVIEFNQNQIQFIKDNQILIKASSQQIVYQEQGEQRMTIKIDEIQYKIDNTVKQNATDNVCIRKNGKEKMVKILQKIKHFKQNKLF